MGSSHSTPPPLVQVSAPRGKVLVPPGTAFTVYPPPLYARSRFDRYTRGAGAGPVYTPYAGGRARARRGWNNTRYGHDGGTDIDIVEETSDDGETMTAEMMTMNDGMRRRRGGVKVNPIDMDMMGQIGTFERLDPVDTRPRSATEMPGAGGYTSMPMGMSANGLGTMQQPYGMPPEYTSNPNLAEPSGDGIMAGAGMGNTFVSYPAPRPSLLSSNDRPSPQPMPRRRLNHYEHIPMGVYADVKRSRKSPEPHAGEQTSTNRNCEEPSGKLTPCGQGLGPGHEWLKGDAFLDACTCTTGCRCRKGQRVLYCARDSRQNVGGGSEGEQREYTSGEIRYILKDDVGRDCGDHTRCQKSEGHGHGHGGEDQSQKKKHNKEGKKLHRQLQSFKNELLDALDERFDDMRWERRQRGDAQSPAKPSLRPSGWGQGASMVSGWPPLEGRSMARPTGSRKYQYPRHGVVRPEFSPMPHGGSGLASAGLRGHGSDVPDLEDEGHDAHNMERRPATEPNSTSRYEAVAGQYQDVYSQGPGGRGAANQRHRSHSRRGRRSSQGDYESDKIDFGLDERWMRADAGQQQQQRAGRERTRRGGGRLGQDRQQRAERHREGAMQARADSHDESEY